MVNESEDVDDYIDIKNLRSSVDDISRSNTQSKLYGWNHYSTLSTYSGKNKYTINH